MRRLLATTSALVIAGLLSAGCGLLAEEQTRDDIETFSYTDEDDKNDFIDGCADSADGNRDMCEDAFRCYEEHVPIEKFRKYFLDVLDNGVENADTSRFNKRAQACIINVLAADPGALGGYDDPATKAGFVRECVAGGAGVVNAEKLCRDVYACLEEKLPFEDYIAMSQAEVNGTKVDRRIEKRFIACVDQVAKSS